MYPNEPIELDDKQFRESWRQFVQSSAAEGVRQRLSTSWVTCLVWWFILLIVGLIKLATVRWTLEGLQLLHAVVTFAPFGALKDNPRRRPELYQPLLAHPVIVKPDGKHALVLGTFESSNECSHARNAEIAKELAELFTTGGDGDSDPETLALLRDNEYRPDRRRRVPASHNYGFKLLLLDVELDLAECVDSPEETLLMAMVARQGDHGPIAQLPWSVAAPAVRMTSS